MAPIGVFARIHLATDFTGISTGDNMSGLNMVLQSASQTGLVSTCETLPSPRVLSFGHLILNVNVDALCNRESVIKNFSDAGSPIVAITRVVTLTPP